MSRSLPSPDDHQARSPRWYVGHTLACREAVAQTHLQRQGIETFLPQILTKRSHARKLETVKAPMFPRYIFVRLDLARDRWRSVNGTIGMSYLVTTRDHPCALPVGFVEELRRLADGDVVASSPPGFVPGDTVSVRAGPFAGHIGKLVSVGPNGRIAMLLEMLNGSVRLTVAHELLEIVG